MKQTRKSQSRVLSLFIHCLLRFFSYFLFLITVHYNSIIIFHKILLKIHIILFYTLKVVQLMIFYISQKTLTFEGKICEVFTRENLYTYIFYY